MRHVNEGILRRLVDEPRAVADTHSAHVDRCGRCRKHGEAVVSDAMLATRLLARPQPLPDVDAAWRRLQAGSDAAPHSGTAPHVAGRRLRWRLSAIPAPPRPALALGGAVLVGAAATGALTAVFGSTPAAPSQSPASATEMQAVVDTFGVGGAGLPGGFDSLAGSRKLGFADLRWSTAGKPRQVASIADAERITGMSVRGVPASLPAGVGAPSSILVEPQLTATITFGPAAGRPLAGTSLTVSAGPAVLVEYGGQIGDASALAGLPVLATIAMERPTLSSSTSSASVARLSAFLLSRTNVPDGLAQVIRLAGNGGTVLPVPLPAGAGVSQVDVDGSPGLLVTDGAGDAAGILWEGRNGMIQAALGLLDQEDILNVANQLG